MTFDSPETPTTPDDKCVRCGYSLKALGDDTPCPECSLPAGTSRRAVGLVFADPDYLRRLIFGSMIAGAGVICWVIGKAFGVLMGSGATAGSTNGIITFFASAVTFAGWLLLSSRDPSGVSEREFRFKTVFRVLLIACLTAEFGELLSVLVPSLRPVLIQFGFGPFAAANGALNIPAQGLWFTVDLARAVIAILFLRELFNLLGNKQMSKLCTHLLWINPLLWTIFFACLFIGPIVATILTLIALVNVGTTANTLLKRQAI